MTNEEIVHKQLDLIERWAFELSELRELLRNMLPIYRQGVACGEKELWLSDEELAIAQLLADRAQRLLDATPEAPHA